LAKRLVEVREDAGDVFNDDLDEEDPDDYSGIV